jgi:diguanylate cyclase (GGDEF)-like protein
MFDPMEIIVNSTGALVYVIDLSTYEILYANERCKEEFGQVTGQTCYKVLQSAQETPCHFCPLHQHDESPLSHPLGTMFEWENKNSINQRSYMFVDRIIEWRDGRAAKVQIGIDITNQKKLEEDMKKKEKEILQLAYYDALTNLPNRVLFKEFLTHMIKRVERNLQYGALLFIDLDHFKMVNDTKGHEIGDLVLKEAAQRIQGSIRQIDLVARLGGDEFVVAIETFEHEKSRVTNNLALIVKKILEELQAPYLINDFDFRLTASIGIVLFMNESHSVDELMKFADSAMYNAKENGRDTYRFFDPQLQQIMELKALLTERLRKAIDNNAMELHYQPQIFVQNSQQIIGVEALVRWNDSAHGIISPGNFIPIAEESGLIVALGEWILRESMQQLKRWEEDKIKKEWRISVNVSYKQFEQNNFIDLLHAMTCEFKIDPSKLRLELTESLLIKNTDAALKKIHILKALGFSLSIDDFGTGYSSLAYLKQLPINELKIDQSFIRDLVIDANDFIIVETILSIGRKFNLEVIAEGVETQEQYEQLISMGCKYFQGYLFGKPTQESGLKC